MLPSLLTAVCFAASGVCGRRAAVSFGPLRGNAWRLLIAAAVLGALDFLDGDVVDFTTRAALRLLVSGVVGFGLGDVALFLAYPRLGSRLTLLINLCSAPLFGALADAWLTGARVSPAQAVAGGLILLGVSLALGQGVRIPGHDARTFVPGVAAALVAGLGQGCGAALTRWAKLAEVEDGVRLSALEEAWVRVLPGLAFGVLTWWGFARVLRLGSQPAAGMRSGILPRGRGRPWLLAAALFGPVLGVGSFQWALSTATSAVVLSITATTPILVMPLAMWLERDRPGYAALGGAAIAVAGVVGMGLLSAA